jgi:hypothetical protein
VLLTDRDRLAGWLGRERLRHRSPFLAHVPAKAAQGLRPCTGALEAMSPKDNNTTLGPYKKDAELLLSPILRSE